MHATKLLTALVIMSALLGGSGPGSTGRLEAQRPAEYGYVTSTVVLPATAHEAYAYGSDVDGDGTVDNALGSFFASFPGQSIVNFQAAVDAAIVRGDLLMLHSVRTRSLANTNRAMWQVLYSEPTQAPDLSGSGSFTVASAPRSGELLARITDNQVETAVGAIPLRLDLGDGIFALELKQAKVLVECSEVSCTKGRLVGAVTTKQVATELIPRLAISFTAVVARDCTHPQPTSCADGSDGEVFQTFFDTDGDMLIAAEELANSSLISAALQPDLDLELADGSPGQDGVADALSVGFGFESVRAGLVRQ